MCNKQDLCSYHSRVDNEEPLQADRQPTRAHYVGDYCVVTVDNPQLRSMAELARTGVAVLAPPFFVTVVVRVGAGAISDIDKDYAGANLWDAIVFKQEHTTLPDDFLFQFGSYEDFKKQATISLNEQLNEAHDMIVDGVKAGFIPASEDK